MSDGTPGPKPAPDDPIAVQTAVATGIPRSTWIDDDGSGLTGTVINNLALQTDVYGRIDSLLQAPAGIGLGGPLAERGRTAAMGEWIPVPYAAGNFAGSGGMTWTVALGGVLVNQYSLVGKTCTFTFDITGTAGGTAAAAVYLVLPLPAAQYVTLAYALGSINPGYSIGYGSLSGAYLFIYRDPTLATKYALGSLEVQGVVTYPIG